MKGSDKVRFCEHCALEVNNISTMTRKAAMKMVRESEGRICVRYVKNPANDKPVFADKLYRIASRAPRLAVGAMSAALSLTSIAYAQGDIVAVKPTAKQTEVSRNKNSKKDKKEKPTATVSGTVTDPNGAVIPGATVTVQNIETNVTAIATTNDEGAYSFPLLLPGQYKVTANASSFQTSVRESLQLNVDARLNIDFQLAIGNDQSAKENLNDFVEAKVF